MSVKRTGAILTLLLLVGARVPLCTAETYTFGGSHAEVRFTYQVGFVSQTARFTEVAGSCDFDEMTLERGRIEAVIKTASLTASEPFIEEKLKSSDFFNAAARPEIRFKSRSVKPAGGNNAELAGDLTMNGITRPVTFHITFQKAGRNGQIPVSNSPHLTATAHILRSNFNMTALSFLVGDEVDIELDAALRKKQ